MSVFQVVLSLFAVLFTGYLLKRRAILQETDAAILNRLILDVTAPAFVFQALYRQRITGEMVQAAVLFALLQLVVMGVVWLVASLWRLPRPVVGTLLLTAVYGNTGFLGYPVVQAIFGTTEGAMAAAVVYDQFSMALPVYTIGVVVAMRFGEKQDLHWREIWQFFTTPVFLTLITTLLLNAWGVRIPRFLEEALRLVAGATVPLVLLSLGLMLNFSPLRSNRYYLPLAFSLVVKMAFFPLLMWWGSQWLGVGGIAREVALTQAAMPSAMVNAVITERYGCDHRLATLVIVVGTLLTLITLPTVVTLLAVR